MNHSSASEINVLVVKVHWVIMRHIANTVFYIAGLCKLNSVCSTQLVVAKSLFFKFN